MRPLKSKSIFFPPTVHTILCSISHIQKILFHHYIIHILSLHRDIFFFLVVLLYSYVQFFPRCVDPGSCMISIMPPPVWKLQIFHTQRYFLIWFLFSSPEGKTTSFFILSIDYEVPFPMYRHFSQLYIDHTIISPWIYRIPSELRSQAGLSLSSTVMGDLTGRLSVVCFVKYPIVKDVAYQSYNFVSDEYQSALPYLDDFGIWNVCCDCLFSICPPELSFVMTSCHHMSGSNVLIALTCLHESYVVQTDTHEYSFPRLHAHMGITKLPVVKQIILVSVFSLSIGDYLRQPVGQPVCTVGFSILDMLRFFQDSFIHVDT